MGNNHSTYQHGNDTWSLVLRRTRATMTYRPPMRTMKARTSSHLSALMGSRCSMLPIISKTMGKITPNDDATNGAGKQRGKKKKKKKERKKKRKGASKERREMR